MVKEFDLDADGLHRQLQGTVTALGAGGDAAAARPLTYAIRWGPAVGDITREQPLREEGRRAAVSGRQGAAADAEGHRKQPMREGDFQYAGVDDNYFMTVALLPGQSKVTLQAVSIPPPANSKDRRARSGRLRDRAGQAETRR